MKKYHFTIMSIDPDEDPEDNHQKYGVTGEGKDQKSAEEDAKSKFIDEYGGLPIFWIQCNGEKK